MFVRTRLFQQLGGFREDTIEDLDFSDRALAVSPSVLLSQKVDTDARKFTQIGEFRALLQVVSIVWRYEKQRPVGHEAFFEPYR